MKSEFDTENIAQFLEGMLQSEESKMSEEERKKDYTPSPPPDIELETDKEGLYIDHEASKCLKFCHFMANTFHSGYWLAGTFGKQ